MASLIPLSVIDDIRRNVDEAAMPDTMTIIRKTSVSNGRGGSTSTTVETETPCRWVIARTNNSEEGSTQIKARGEYTPAVPLETDIKETDTVRFNGKLYNVVWTPVPGAYSTSRIVGLERL